MSAVFRKNLIFDLGGVLLELNHEESLRRFKKTGIREPDLSAKWPQMQQIILDFELGKSGTRAFHSAACKLFEKQIPFAVFADAWNAILDHFPRERLEMLFQLQEKHALYLLSNTNPLHALTYERWFREKSGNSMSRVFTKIWYSHILGLRKPDPQFFTAALNDGGLKAQDCLFFDDKRENVEAARATGIYSWQVTPENDIVKLIKKLNSENLIR